MKKTKKFLALVAVFAMVALAVPVRADREDHEMPGRNDPFWVAFANMTKPDDYGGCIEAITDYVNGLNFQDEGDREGLLSGMTQMCTEIQTMPAQMEADMTADGAQTNLFGASNWHSVENLYFQKSENGQVMGRISFSQPVDFMSYNFFNFMNNFGNLVRFNDGYISLNSAMTGDMASFGAQLTMYDLPYSEEPDIYVSDGATMKKAVEGDDITNITWDGSAGSLTFAPTHFSSFKVVGKGSSLRTMKIKSVKKKSIHYKAGKNSFKVTVRGKNLRQGNGEADCTLGFKQAQKIYVSKNGKHIKCTFRMSDFSVTGYYPLTVTIPGTGEVTKTNAVRIR